MARLIERLGRWLEGSPTKPSSEVESRISEMIRQQKAVHENYLKQERATKEAQEARVYQEHQRSLAIWKESKIGELLEDAKKALRLLYPSATIVKDSPYSGTLVWKNAQHKEPAKPCEDESYNVRVFVDGTNNKLSLLYRTTRDFTSGEWTNTKVLSEAIIEAVKNPDYIPIRDRGE